MGWIWILLEEQAVMVLDNVTDKDFVAKKNLEGVSDIEIRSSSRDSSSSEGHEGNDQSEKVPIAQDFVFSEIGYYVSAPFSLCEGNQL